ncbi:MAG: hypothetical protein ACLUOI_19020 [Eisenbergiella sp.]
MVPITGFANSVAVPVIDLKGQVLVYDFHHCRAGYPV